MIMYRSFFLFLFISTLFSQTNFPNSKVQLIDNKSTNLHSLTSEVSFVSFWATWCIPCIKEIDKLNKFIDDYENVSVILINEDKPGDKAKVKLKVKKYNPATRKHEFFVEKKLPPNSK